MQIKAHSHGEIDREFDDRPEYAVMAAEARDQSHPTINNAQIDAMLEAGTDRQAEQFARYAVAEAAQDGVFEAGWH